MSTSPSTMQSVRFQRTGDGGLSMDVLDQLLLPDQHKYIPIHNVQDAWSVIRKMQIRGAPLIAIVAILGLAVDLCSPAGSTTANELAQQSSAQALQDFIQQKMDYLSTSRPTAVNLFNALEEMKLAVHDTITKNSSVSMATLVEEIKQMVVKQAEFMLERDVNDNKAIGNHGADYILGGQQQQQQQQAPNDGKQSRKVTIMTICNTGSLATAAYGTALGVVRALRDRDLLESVVALETRPYNQGSRLTATEMETEQMPGRVLISDSMAAAYMAQHKVDAVVVGADRVCANGDTANKIGTFNLSLVASQFGAPVFVAAPFTTLDVNTATGDEITIEQRPPDEFINTSQAPKTIPVWNPAFDVTPAKYIAGIITEKGVIANPTKNNTIDVAQFVRDKTTTTTNGTSDGNGETKKSPIVQAGGYVEQTVETLASFLESHCEKAMEVLGTTSAKDLECREMGDGNLNLVFIVKNKNVPSKQVIVKQALPYVRCVGESWPMTIERAYFESEALRAEKLACPIYVPDLYYFSHKHGLIVMQYLPPPIIILRKGLIQGIKYPTMSTDMGIFCAHTLFKTSGFKLSTSELREKVAFWSKNKDMCGLTEQVIFTEPYTKTDNNRWTSPQLDADKAAIEADEELKLCAAKYKRKFVTETMALIHADLHSGSVMCKPEPHQTFVIDPEFAFYGPMGFDTGAFIANLFLSYVSQAGHSNGPDYAEWILTQIETFWNTFVAEMVNLWNNEAEHVGFLYGRNLLTTESSVKLSQSLFLGDLFRDTLGFAGMKMLRRIVGIAHVEDLESIADPNVRATCERHGLAIAKAFIKEGHAIASIEEATQLARDKKQK